MMAAGIFLPLLRDPATLKKRLVSRWFQLSIVWSIFWFASAALDIFLRSRHHFGKEIFEMPEMRPILILGPALTLLPWVITLIAAGALWLYRRAGRRNV